MVASSSVLNAPNCTVPCTGSLNRATCEVAEMCGDCADGFVGVLGPSNEACYSENEHCANGVLDGSETDVDCGGHCAPCKDAMSCTVNADCEYSWCNARGVCAVPVKPCPGSNCTMGQGVCSHVDVTGVWLDTRDCLANDWACSAVCTCGERFDVNGSAVGMWYGDDCSLDEVGFAEVVALRNHLLDSLGLARDMQDATTDALNQQASSLSSLSANPSQLAGGGEFQALGLVGAIAASSEAVGLSDGTSDTIGGTISALLASGVLSANVASNVAAKYSPTVAPTAAPIVTQRHHARRSRRVLLDSGSPSPTSALTTALADGAALTTIAAAIASLSAAQLEGAVAGEVA